MWAVIFAQCCFICSCTFRNITLPANYNQNQPIPASSSSTVKDKLGWTDVSGDSRDLRLRGCVVTHQEAADAPCPLVITHSVVVVQ